VIDLVPPSASSTPSPPCGSYRRGLGQSCGGGILTPSASFSRMLPLRPRASLRSRGSASGPRGGQRPASTSKGQPPSIAVGSNAARFGTEKASQCMKPRAWPISPPRPSSLSRDQHAGHRRPDVSRAPRDDILPHTPHIYTVRLQSTFFLTPRRPSSKRKRRSAKLPTVAAAVRRGRARQAL